jgi:hypothetical protein
MQNSDVDQSFTAQLFVGDKPVAEARKVLGKMLESQEIQGELRQLLRDLRESDPQELSYGEGVTPETFYFKHQNGVYTIRIKRVDGLFNETASMEGSPRNLSKFKGDDPTYYRIANISGEIVKLDEIPDDVSEVYLYTGPQQRPVKTYGEPPFFPVLTDDPNRIGSPLVFTLKILDRDPRDVYSTKS